jgi:hypothetical protein
MVNIKGLTAEQLKELEFSAEECAELEKARSMTVSFDKDCPETTPERAIRFHRVNPSHYTEEKRA